MDENTAETALKGLKPTSVSAQVRAMMPMIEEQIAKGVAHAEIVKALNDAGLSVAFTNFESILYRYRKKWGKSSRQTPSADTAAGTSTSIKPKPRQPDDAGGKSKASETTNEPGRVAFERSLDPVARDQFAEQFMGRRRPIIDSTKNRSDHE